MNKNISLIILLVVVFLGAFLLIKNGNKEVQNEESVLEYNPQINPVNFTSNITNPYFTLTPGKKWVYEAKTEDGTERGEFYVTHEKKTVLGVETVVVWDRVWLNGSLIEDTRDWFAEDRDGNVWYFGEDSVEMLNGKIISHHGSWEAGVDGAKPGIIMEAAPKVGDSYREEYYKGEAEDRADVLSLSESVKVPFGSFTNCLKTKNYTALEPDAIEYKYYCKEVGNAVLEIDAQGTERVELISVQNNAQPSPSSKTSNSKVNTNSQSTTIMTETVVVPPITGAGSQELKTNITEEQAKTIALQRVPRKVTDVTIENKFGKTAYVVEIDADNGPESDVIVDMNTGEILGVEQ